MAGRKSIALLTDFGPDNHYVAQMKGRVMGICPDASIVDITHSVSPQDIVQGAYLLRDSIEAFPANTIFVVVVDPGVGTDRKILVVEADAYQFVLPDNGLISVIKQDFTVRQVVAIDSSRLPASNTFHGRDIMAPVAAKLASGKLATDLGSEFPGDQVVDLDLQPVELREQSGDVQVRGQLVYSDCFGNLISNIPASILPSDRSRCTVRMGEHHWRGIHGTFSDVAKGSSLALIGSHSRLEIAVNQGNAKTELAPHHLNSVIVSWRNE